MKREIPAICAVCGRTIDRGVAPDLSGRCERCAESDPTGSDDGDRNGLVESLSTLRGSDRDAALERLRGRYYEARGLIAKDDSDPDHRGQLDWIFGVNGDDERSTPSFDARTSELVVLWLEDLIRHLEQLEAWGTDPRDPGSTATPNQRAASGLHAATRAFADAFRRAAEVECAP